MPVNYVNLEESFIAFAKPPYGCAWISPYARSPKISTALQNATFQSYSFEKKLCRKAFKQNFGLKLPVAADITMAIALFNNTPHFKSANYNGIKRQKSLLDIEKPRNTDAKHLFDAPRKLNHSSLGIQSIPEKSRFKTMWTCSGLQLLSATWA